MPPDLYDGVDGQNQSVFDPVPPDKSSQAKHRAIMDSITVHCDL
jgi:hypothetical protein